MDLTQGQKLKLDTIRGLVEALERGECGVQNPNASRGVSKREEPEEEEMDDFVLLGGQEPLLSSQPLPDLVTLASEQCRDVVVKRAEDEAAQERSKVQLMSSVGAVLKQAVTSSCCTPECWGLLGRWHGLQGSEGVDARKEALLKQVRGLATIPFKSDVDPFERMARASVDLCRAYLDSARLSSLVTSGEGPVRGGGGSRDLSAARMHLRGVVKQCEASFEGHVLLNEMKDLLGQVEAQQATHE